MKTNYNIVIIININNKSIVKYNIQGVSTIDYM